MPDSRRELLLKAAQAAVDVASVDLNGEETTKPAGLVVHRFLTRMPDSGSLPDVTLWYAGEGIDDRADAATDESQRSVRVRARCRAKAAAGQTGDEALDPILTWVELAMLADYSLGGLAAEGQANGIDAVSAREFADTYAEATIEFEFLLLTKRGDPRQAS